MGIADAHGIESFIKVTKDNQRDAFGLLLRAQANRHRHALFFVLNITESATKPIKKLLKQQQFIEALKLLKGASIVGRNIDFPKQYNAKKSWRLIPNPELDPYR